MNAADIMAALQKHGVRHFEVLGDFQRSGDERCMFQWWCDTPPGEVERWGFGHAGTPGEALERMLEQVAESKQAGSTPLENAS